ncbi:MAG: PucC family protein, partial [Pseudomonadota bacterium]
RRLASGAQSFRTAALGILFGLVGFSAIILSGPFSTVLLFQIGVVIIGFGGGTFSVCTMTAIMDFTDGEASGIALGAWGAVQATCAGLAIAVGGAIRDALSSLAEAGILGPALSNISVGYVVVYHIEILLLFVSLAIIGPLARYGPSEPTHQKRRLTISAFPQ